MTGETGYAARVLEYCRQADASRRRASETTIPDIKRQWIDLAEQYEALARGLERITV
jgi:hypothetical protein